MAPQSKQVRFAITTSAHKNCPVGPRSPQGRVRHTGDERGGVLDQGRARARTDRTPRCLLP